MSVCQNLKVAGVGGGDNNTITLAPVLDYQGGLSRLTCDAAAMQSLPQTHQIHRPTHTNIEDAIAQIHNPQSHKYKTVIHGKNIFGISAGASCEMAWPGLVCIFVWPVHLRKQNFTFQLKGLSIPWQRRWKVSLGRLTLLVFSRRRDPRRPRSAGAAHRGHALSIESQGYSNQAEAPLRKNT